MSIIVNGNGTITGIDEGLNTSGVITATSYRGDGSQLTGISGLKGEDGNIDGDIFWSIW